MPRFRIEDLDEDLELDDQYSTTQRIKHKEKKLTADPPPKKKFSPKHSGIRPDKA